jgi:hypothetical protein
VKGWFVSKLFVGPLVSTESTVLNPSRPLHESSGSDPVNKAPLSQRKRLDSACGLGQQFGSGNNPQKILTTKNFGSAPFQDLTFLEPVNNKATPLLWFLNHRSLVFHWRQAA